MPKVRFAHAIFEPDASFDEAHFSCVASFDEAHFSCVASFDEAHFSGDASFDKAKFGRDAFFSEAIAWAPILRVNFDFAPGAGEALIKHKASSADQPHNLGPILVLAIASPSFDLAPGVPDLLGRPAFSTVSLVGSKVRA